MDPLDEIDEEIKACPECQRTKLCWQHMQMKGKAIIANLDTFLVHRRIENNTPSAEELERLI